MGDGDSIGHKVTPVNLSDLDDGVTFLKNLVKEKCETSCLGWVEYAEYTEVWFGIQKGDGERYINVRISESVEPPIELVHIRNASRENI